jgi:hypothetical protein
MRKLLVSVVMVMLLVVSVVAFADDAKVERTVVGVVMSDYSARWFAELGFSGDHWDYLALMKNIFDFVNGLGYKAVPIFDRDLELYANPESDPVVKFTRTYNLDQVKLLILCDTRRLSPLEVEAVKKFISEGGKVLALSQVSFRDHNNSKFDNPDVFGLSNELKISYSSFAWKPPAHGYIKKAADHPIWEGLDEFIPTTRHWVMVVKTLEGGKVLGEWFNDDKILPSHMPDLNGAIIEAHNTIYIGEDLFIPINFKEPMVQMLLANIILYLMQ